MLHASMNARVCLNRVGITLCLVLLAWTGLAAQERQERPQPPSSTAMPAELLAAQTFVLTAYPDLAQKPLLITLRPDGDAVLVSVAEDPGRIEPQSVPSSQVIAVFEYDKGVRLRRFEARGPLLNEARTDALRQQLLANPRWAESDADVWLTREGAASTFGTVFTPAQASAVGVLERQLGVSRTSAPPRFRWHVDDGPPSGDPPRFRSRPVWTTEAVGVGPSGTADLYQFEYEPFGGRLVGVVRR